MVFWLVGLSGAGKTTIGREVYSQLKPLLPNTVFLDGDEIRALFGHEGKAAYTIEGRRENARRMRAICLWLDRQGIHVICSILSVFEDDRRSNREDFSDYFEVYIDASLEDLMERDSKGLYKGAMEGRIPNVVGVDIYFPPPQCPDMTLKNGSPLLDSRLAAKSIIDNSGIIA